MSNAVNIDRHIDRHVLRTAGMMIPGIGRGLPATAQSGKVRSSSASSFMNTKELAKGIDDRIRILCVDDHPLMREGIAAMITGQPDMVLVAQASTGSEGIQKAREYAPDVTLMDLRLPDMSGVDYLTAMRSHMPEARVIIFTTFKGDVEIQRSLAAGAWGFMLKSMPPQQLLEVIRQVHDGKKRIVSEIANELAEHLSDEPLTSRETEVLKQIAGGNRNRDIGRLLFIAEETVKVHIKHIMEKLGATDRTQSVAIAVRRGIIQL